MQGLKRVVCEIEGSMEVGVEQVVVCRERAEMRIEAEALSWRVEAYKLQSVEERHSKLNSKVKVILRGK